MGEPDQPCTGGALSPSMPSWLSVVLDEIVDITIVTVALFLLLRALRGSRALLAFVGVLIIGLVDLVARLVDLPLTALFFRGLFLTSVVVVLLAFQDDLKRFFERLAVWGLGRQSPAPGDSVIESVVRASFALAAARQGALIVLPGRDPLDRHLEGGIPLDGTVSDVLLLSLFDPHSPGHDGAIVVDAERVRRFGVHLPLSANFAALRSRGTRHAAALGLAERSDALVIVVSEERGVVSVAEGGALEVVSDPDALRNQIAAFVERTRAGPVERRRSLRWVLRRAGEWSVALVLAFSLWTLVVLGSEVGETSLRAPVQVTNLPAGYVLRSTTPSEVRVSLTGVWRRLFLLEPSDVSVSVDALLAQLGRRTFQVTPQDVHAPPGVSAVDVEPDRVVLDVEAPPPPAAPGQP
jgi:diadenylate cyclase